MKIFNCDHCGHPVFFENVTCLNCDSTLAFLPGPLTLAALEPVPGAAAPALWQRRDGEADGTRYRMCRNHDLYQACNFAVPADDANPLCLSCRQTRLLPDLSAPSNLERWYRIEAAKRRLYYTLARLGLMPTVSGTAPVEAPVFEFLADLPGEPPVLTGHRQGVITLNVAEADDDERARRRLALHEPYRTLLGHLRHESGHYYWDRLILAPKRLASFREVFGDESADYLKALEAHYAAGASAGDAWQEAHVSAYATAHPWEDWAETWAHYLHMVDLLETASTYQTTVVVPGAGPGQAAGASGPVANPFAAGDSDFDEMVRQWVPVTLLLNSLNRSLGQNDAYPFALREGALRKLRYVHDVIQASTGPAAAAATPVAAPQAAQKTSPPAAA
ncbi:zinc-binding metallopeptidase family protein [Variovorax terrae]|uniref:Zinc-binding peptidase n=1 Tax=Variovorax terrae TaxID=2923278 RepID=A0A9X1VWJ7_9BURK|nr:putative zinc-binding peptidase [Variovorax terrae]MCJ0765121.1 putative zinc-binding peptidase [Variovorax terrae]